MNFRDRQRRAFTLIEILVVTLILGLVLSAVAACLSGGLRAWDSVQNFSETELNVLPAMEMVEKDLKNSFDFYAIALNGSDRHIEFAGLVESEESYRDGGGGRVPAKIRYSFDLRSGALMKDAWIYPGEDSHESERVISGIRDMQFEYYYVTGSAGGAGVWDEFREDGTNFLQGVRMRMDVEGDGKRTMMTRTVILPVTRMQVPGQERTSRR